MKKLGSNKGIMKDLRRNARKREEEDVKKITHG
jgi:hypothetical protein